MIQYALLYSTLLVNVYSCFSWEECKADCFLRYYLWCFLWMNLKKIHAYSTQPQLCYIWETTVFASWKEIWATFLDASAGFYLRNDALCILERDMGNILRCLSWVIFEKRLSLHPGCSIDEEDIKKLYWREIKAILSNDGKISPTPPQEARPHPREGYNYYITCYLGNITVQERYGQHS